ncbi:hypothetical protein FG99_17770 [Pseudomonas sp. AAC]|nr:hypothetical protein FG99_17770 [Pseudomonas sp. AAC]
MPAPGWPRPGRSRSGPRPRCGTRSGRGSAGRASARAPGRRSRHSSHPPAPAAPPAAAPPPRIRDGRRSTGSRCPQRRNRAHCRSTATAHNPAGHGHARGPAPNHAPGRDHNRAARPRRRPTGSGPRQRRST